jgi:nitronate monooxygenase
MQTAATRLLGIEEPIVQAPIGGLTNPALAAAVSNAGGLGMLAVTWLDEAEIRRRIRATRDLTDRPFGVNLILEWPMEERLRACLEEGVRVVSFFWGDPTPLIPAVHAVGGIALLTVGSSLEAERAIESGIDALVAQGWEAGGHVRGEVTTLALVPRVADVAGSVPVIAAGGVADGRGLAAVLDLGAGAAWMGTRFVASVEAGAHPRYLEAIFAARETDTVHSTLFDGGWPDAPHRTLRNATVEAWRAAGSPPSGARPGEGEVLARTADGEPVRRYESASAPASSTGAIEELSLWAGQSAGLIREVLPAAEIVRRTTAEANAIRGR